MPGLSGLPFSAESRVMAGDTVGMRSRLSQAYVATKLSDVTDLNARARQSFSDGGRGVRSSPQIAPASYPATDWRVNRQLGSASGYRPTQRLPAGNSRLAIFSITRLLNF